eukprot:10627236-Alexandrium_andersonii.AAC.1
MDDGPPLCASSPYHVPASARRRGVTLAEVIVSSVGFNLQTGWAREGARRWRGEPAAEGQRWAKAPMVRQARNR